MEISYQGPLKGNIFKFRLPEAQPIILKTASLNTKFVESL